MKKNEIRNLLQEAHRLMQAGGPRIAQDLARLQIKLQDAFPDRFHADIDQLYVAWLRSGEPVTDELVTVIEALQKQPQIIGWFTFEEE